jgi:AcrR family transcriptional regulator
MEDIAREAGVGRATLYRRFATPAAVALELLDEHEHRLQEAIMRGEPPLGPGAPPADRLAAFFEAMIGLLDDHLHLALGAETGGARFATGAYQFWRAHVRHLLREARIGEPDAMVDILLAPLAPEIYRYQRYELGIGREQITAALGLLARRVAASDSPAPESMRDGWQRSARVPPTGI